MRREKKARRRKLEARGRDIADLLFQYINCNGIENSYKNLSF
jgi:hypothetical protein